MHIKNIKKELAEQVPELDIARKVYLVYPTYALIGHEDIKFEILNEIAIEFNIPINHIHICGSSQTGRSFHKKNTFDKTKSDLDIAIIDNNLFNTYTELVHKLTDGLNNLTLFKNNKTVKRYKKNIVKGFFRPDLMPSCSERADWFAFFNNITNKHKHMFVKINAGIYSSTFYFEHKQKDNFKFTEILKTY